MNCRLFYGLALLPLVCVALIALPPTVEKVAAQEFRGRRGDDEGGRGGESRREGRRRFGRGQAGDGGEGNGQFRRGGDGGGREFRRDGREGSGGFGFRRRGGNDGDRPDDRPARVSGASSFGGGTLDTASYARRLVQENDKDGNMMLSKEEQGGLRGPAASADFNNDGVIAIDEIVAALSKGGTAGGPAANGSTSGAGGPGSRSGERGRGELDPGRSREGSTGPVRVYTAISASNGTDKTAEERRTYRFTPATDRLPSAGLPSWFKSRDRNGDGQVAMSEYSRSWSDRTVNEFRRYDLNDDGVVTAKEAAKK